MNRNNRIVIFLCICITLRAFLAYLANKLASSNYLKLMGIFALIVSSGLIYQFIANPNKPGGFGGDSWWNNVRPVHAALYLVFAVMTVINPKYAYLALILDVIFGLGVFTLHYTKHGQILS